MESVPNNEGVDNNTAAQQDGGPQVQQEVPQQEMGDNEPDQLQQQDGQNADMQQEEDPNAGMMPDQYNNKQQMMASGQESNSQLMMNNQQKLIQLNSGRFEDYLVQALNDSLMKKSKYTFPFIC